VADNTHENTQRRFSGCLRWGLLVENSNLDPWNSSQFVGDRCPNHTASDNDYMTHVKE
jgi:hypothetical protein